MNVFDQYEPGLALPMGLGFMVSMLTQTHPLWMKDFDIIEELHDDLLPKKEVALKTRLWYYRIV